MKFSDIIDQASALLQRKGRLTYRSLKLEFALDDEHLDVLKEELIEGQRVAVDEDGKVLVWVGKDRLESRVQSPMSKTSRLPDSGLRSAGPGPWTPPHLADRIRAAAITDGERKTITALFADLKGSTALIEGLDPEEARAIIDPALQLMMDAVHHYDGYVAQALGDGIFALFGAPIAHEDHPQRALYAALRMQDEMRRYGDQVRLKQGVPLAMRVGINTGEVVVRSIHTDALHADYVPVGYSTNLAARMEQMATPGSILVTAYTHKLTDGYFAFKDLGQTQLKGVEEPLHVYEVLGAGPLRTRLQVAATRGLTRFVGRQRELEHLRAAWERVHAGHGQVVAVMGEPGVGKSRLFYEFKRLLQMKSLLLEAYSVSHAKASPYLPVIELLRSYFRIEPRDDDRTRREKIGGKVLMLDRSLEETLPYLFVLFGIEERPSSFQQMDPQIRRKRTFEALKKVFVRESLNQPLILIFEDLHWVDSETQGFLDTLSEDLASAKVLLLVNYRPEYRHEWSRKTEVTHLRLAPFGKVEAEEFLDELLGANRAAFLGRERDKWVETNALLQLKQLTLEKTEGTPFFMEEIVQALREQGVLTRDGVATQYVASLSEVLSLPTTVQGVLAARIDRLMPGEKTLLQQLAVIGREFPLGLVQHVIAQPEDDLYHLLSSLQQKEFLYEQPAFPEVEYLFKHALTQEVAYNSVLIERRKALHEQTGHAIEQLYHDQLDEHYDELAHHFSRSENVEKAIVYLHRAGQQAAQRSANDEAVALLTEAVALVHQLPPSRQHWQQELALHTTLGPLLIATRGYAAQETERAWTRAYALCQQVEDTSQLSPVLWGLHQLYTARVEYQRGQTYGEQLLALAHRVHDPSLLLWAYRGLGESFFCLGECAAARTYCENSISLYDPQQRHAQTFAYGEDPAIGALSFYALSLVLLGYPDRAQQKIHEALMLARELVHANSMGHVSFFAAWVALYRRDFTEARRHAEALLDLATEQGLPHWLATGTVMRGCGLVGQGEYRTGIGEIRQGLAALGGTGTTEGQTHGLAVLAEAYGKEGREADGLAVVSQALTLVEKTGERFHEAELYRIKGQLTLQQFQISSSKFQVPPNPQPLTPNPQEEVEGCFLKAIDIARQQQAKLWELRAVMSLVRLRQHQAQEEEHTQLAEARRMLAKVYAWFTEGFDTRDLHDAKALLETPATDTV